MTCNKLAAGIATALATLFVGTAVLAAQSPASGQGYQCLLTHAPFESHRVITVCHAKTPDALARLRAAKCDPATMSDAAMRAQCEAMRGGSAMDGAGGDSAG